MIVKSQDRQIFDRLTFVGRSGACIRPIPAEKHGQPRPALYLPSKLLLLTRLREPGTYCILATEPYLTRTLLTRDAGVVSGHQEGRSCNAWARPRPRLTPSQSLSVRAAV